MNLIAFQHVGPYHYQKVLDSYEVISIDCSSKDLDNIDMYITMIDQNRGIFKYSAPIGT